MWGEITETTGGAGWQRPPGYDETDGRRGGELFIDSQWRIVGQSTDKIRINCGAFYKVCIGCETPYEPLTYCGALYRFLRLEWRKYWV